MSQIKYADLHCDTVTEALRKGEDLKSFSGQVNTQKLQASGCALQCFAIFTRGKTAAEDFVKAVAYYNAQIAIDPYILPVERYTDIENALKCGKIAAVLTVENMEFLGGDISKIARLKELGVKMASLVWNDANGLGYPNIIFNGEVPDFEKRETRGLTETGRRAVEELNRNRIIIDVSHLSDGGVEDILALSSAPVVASHSNCEAVCPVSRNLTDKQLKAIADKGGVAGINYCRDFVGGETVADTLYKHLKHMLDVGGEDLPALGSDFDGIPPYEEMDTCLKVPELLNTFRYRGIPPRVLEKIAFGNFARVFKEVVG